MRIRPALHIIIGLLYIAIAVYLITVHKFGVIDLGATSSYILGGLLFLYGGFRIWRGFNDMRAQPEEE